MKIKDNSTYVCMATIARKYIVASVTIVRINTENLSELLMRYVYQTIARNADSSRSSPLSTPWRFVLTIGTSANTYQTRCRLNLEST